MKCLLFCLIFVTMTRFPFFAKGPFLIIKDKTKKMLLMTCDPKCKSHTQAGKETENPMFIIDLSAGWTPWWLGWKLEGRVDRYLSELYCCPADWQRLRVEDKSSSCSCFWSRAHAPMCRRPWPTCGRRRTERQVSLSCFPLITRYLSLQSMCM